MKQFSILQEFSSAGKTLAVASVNLGNEVQPQLPPKLIELWKTIVPMLKNSRQVAYVRDLPDLVIDGEYPGGYTPNGSETYIAINEWPADETQLTDAFAHELHHLARWQNGGYGETLGQALISEGMASWFGQLQSGWTAPWIKGEVSNEMWIAAKKDWNSPRYNHPEWFYSGPLGKWVGYRVGYQVAQRVLDDSFNLARSIETSASDGEAALLV